MNRKQQTSYNDPVARVGLVVVAVVFITGVIVVRLAAIQLFDMYDLRDRADNQGMLTETVLPERGLILDRNNKILATNVITYDMGTRYIDLNAPEKTFSYLAKVFNRPASYYRTKTAQSKNYVYLEKDLAPTLMDSLKRSGLCHGLRFERKMKRVYPYRSNASQLLGFVNYDHQGVSGIEKAYNDILSGTPGKRLVKKDQRGNVVSYENGMREAAVDGGSVRLALDIEYQTILEDELRQAVITNQAQNAMGIIMDPRSGEVLAMANYPSFDPNNVGDSKTSQRRNRAVADEFEPGSIFKIVPIAAALDKGVISGASKVYCENGAWAVKDRVIHDSEPHEWLTVEDVLVVSSNIGTGKIVEQAGNRSIYDISRAFGFGERTRIGLREETDGKLRPLSEWSGVDFSQIGMGQGLTTTLLQMTCAYSAIANGGLLLKPRVLLESHDTHHKTLERTETTLLRRVIKKETSSELRSMLEKVVAEGTGKSAYIPGYHLAGKTGTAQKAVKGGYSNNRYYASFMGFFPADDPVLVCGIAVNEPVKGRHYGAVAAAPAVKNVFTGIINTPGFENKVARDIAASDRRRPVALSIISGNSRAVREKETADTDNTSAATQNMENGSIIMPDLIDYPVRYAEFKLKNMGLQVSAGSSRGIVTSQDPLPGTYIDSNTLCKLTAE